MASRKPKFSTLIIITYSGGFVVYLLLSALYPNFAVTLRYYLLGGIMNVTELFPNTTLKDRGSHNGNTNNSTIVKIGLITMATGKYTNFTGRFVEAARTHLMAEHRRNQSQPTYEIHYFIFSDHLEKLPNGTDVTAIYQRRLGWPGDTLWRNQIYLNSSSIMEEMGMNYLFALDADLLFVANVGPEILGERVAALHPGYYANGRGNFPYERRAESCASIESNKGEHYYYGAIFGGTTANFFDICRVTMECAIRDYARNGFIAEWHDESLLNRYLVDHPPTVILSPSYCYPEQLTLPFERKILALFKNHAKMRE